MDNIIDNPRTVDGISLIIPSYNEELSIAEVIAEYQEHLEKCDLPFEIIVVDDGSSDGTARAVSDFGNVRLISHSFNRGYGGALKSGMRLAKRTYIAWFDADAEHRAEDAATGRTGFGSHRSDFAVRHLDKDMPADQCSTGEQKALLIAVVLANARLQAAECGVAPLLLLDEIAAHLDVDKRQVLFETLLGLGVQAWLTGTDPILFDDLGAKAQFFIVADATLRPVA